MCTGCKEEYVTVDGNEKLKRPKCAAPHSCIQLCSDLPSIVQCTKYRTLGGKRKSSSHYCDDHTSQMKMMVVVSNQEMMMIMMYNRFQNLIILWVNFQKITTILYWLGVRNQKIGLNYSRNACIDKIMQHCNQYDRDVYL